MQGLKCLLRIFFKMGIGLLDCHPTKVISRSKTHLPITACTRTGYLQQTFSLVKIFLFKKLQAIIKSTTWIDRDGRGNWGSLYWVGIFLSSLFLSSRNWSILSLCLGRFFFSHGRSRSNQQHTGHQDPGAQQTSLGADSRCAGNRRYQAQ